MATSNLVSKSLGSIKLESGNGSPNHVSPIGSLYYNNTTNMLWQSSDGTFNGWKFMTPAIYGEITIDGNTTLTTGLNTNVFIPLSGLTWSVNNNNVKGFTKSGQKLVLASGLTGTYRIFGSMGIIRGSANNNWKMGVSINGASPTDTAKQSGAATLTTKTVGECILQFDTTLNGGDTVELTLATTLTNATTFTIRDASLIILRTSE